MSKDSIKEIIKIVPNYEDPSEEEIKLSNRADEINLKTQAVELREIVRSLKQTIRETGVSALAAPEIGFNKRIICMDFKDLEIKTFINPVIAQAKGLQLSRETSNVIPDKEYIRPRNNDIEVIYQTPTGKTEVRRLVGVAAYLFQQENDILDGLLLSDVGLELLDGYDEMSDEEKQEIIEIYLDSLDIKTKKFNHEIEQDEDLKQIKDATKFIEAVQKGEVQLYTE